jgi:hypothetical protein
MGIGLIIFMSGISMILAPAHAREKRPCISLDGAKLRLFLLPDSHAARERGSEIGWLVNKGSSKGDVYNITLVGAVSPADESNPLGNYTVNKFTAEIKDVGSEQVIDSKELSGVWRLLREIRSRLYMDERCCK